MIKKIENSAKYSKKHGGFGIDILYPGFAVDLSDTGLATIGRIDQAVVTPGTLIPMHPHRDDEILTYLRSGKVKVKHRDSEGIAEMISNRRLMLMNAGATFYHEELVMNESEVLQGLQIFIRPEKNGLKPMVQFHDLSEVYSINKWRAIAGKGKPFPLQIRSNTWIFDLRMAKSTSQQLPPLPKATNTCLLYVFDGEVQVNEKISLKKGESAIVENEQITITSIQTTDLVLFVTDKEAEFSTTGMYSGNQKNR